MSKKRIVQILIMLLVAMQAGGVVEVERVEGGRGSCVTDRDEFDDLVNNLLYFRVHDYEYDINNKTCVLSASTYGNQEQANILPPIKNAKDFIDVVGKGMTISRDAGRTQNLNSWCLFEVFEDSARTSAANLYRCASYAGLQPEFHKVDTQSYAYSGAHVGSNYYKYGVSIVGEGDYDGSLEEKRDYNYLKMKGAKGVAGSIDILTYSMHYNAYNSPYLYLQNPPRGEVQVKIDSQRDLLHPKPEFSTSNTWELQSDGTDIYQADQKLDHLFYEFDSPYVTLTRNGRNFQTKTELLNYLQDSPFLTKLGLDQSAQDNSLSYIQDKGIPEANNYYLTTLTPESIQEISTLNITPAPEHTLRTIYAIYPTTTPVKTTGDFTFPATTLPDTEEFTVKEFGEIIVQEGMQVMWE